MNELHTKKSLFESHTKNISARSDEDSNFARQVLYPRLRCVNHHAEYLKTFLTARTYEKMMLPFFFCAHAVKERRENKSSTPEQTTSMPAEWTTFFLLPRQREDKFWPPRLRQTSWSNTDKKSSRTLARSDEYLWSFLIGSEINWNICGRDNVGAWMPVLFHSDRQTGNFFVA